MNDTHMQTVQLLVIGSLLLGFALAELAAGRFFPREATREDNRLDLVVTLTFPLISGTVLAASSALCAWIWPQHRGALAHWPWWGMLAVLLVADDLTQYLWHRLSHTSVLWPLHRAHHSAAYMSVRVVYRNNALYYALMPGLWLSGGLLYLGFGWVYVGYTVVKLAVIIGAHSPLRWDAPLYRHRVLHPLAWVLERAEPGRRRGPLQRQLRQPAVPVGRALRHRAHHAPPAARLRPGRRPRPRARALGGAVAVPGAALTPGRHRAGDGCAPAAEAVSRRCGCARQGPTS
jgi:hypothetical protein